MEWFGKPVALGILVFAVVEAVSGLGFLIPWVNILAWVFFVCLAACLTWQKTEWGIGLVLAELLVGSKGYLFWLPVGDVQVSLRIGIFALVFLTWALKKILRPNRQPLPAHLRPILAVWALILLIAAARGFLGGSLSVAYQDANGWAFFILLPAVLSLRLDESIKTNFVQLLIAGTTWLALKTLAVLILFSHGWVHLHGAAYNWIRDTGVGEITYISGTMFRVFFQSHLYSVLGIFLAAGWLLREQRKRSEFVAACLYLYVMMLTLLVSQSRSLWVGLVAGLVVMWVFNRFRWMMKIELAIVFVVVIALAVISQLGLLTVLTGNWSSNPLASRFSSFEADPASVSRVAQLSPLLSTIQANPVFGYGFGKTLTYHSSDPRVLDANPSGEYTTFAFEWGWLDIILKLGLLGAFAYLLLIWKLFGKNLWHDPVVLGSIVTLATINIFTPYLNHPLGIGYLYLLLLTPIRKVENQGASGAPLPFWRILKT